MIDETIVEGAVDSVVVVVVVVVIDYLRSFRCLVLADCVAEKMSEVEVTHVGLSFVRLKILRLQSASPRDLLAAA